MPKWSDLPKESLSIILQYLNLNDEGTRKNDLKRCSLTCRGWRVPAQTILFSEVILNKTGDIDSLTCVALRNDDLRN